jgi:TP901 family phage tail tape measure protein
MAKGATRSVNIYVNNKEAKKSIDELTDRIKKETAAWHKMAKGTQEYYAKAAEISRMNDALERENRLIKSSTERNKDRLNQISMIGSVLSGVVQTVQFLGRSLQKIRDLASDMAGLDDAMGRVRKTTMLSRQEVQELNKEFTKIDTRTSREELNELAYAAGKLGVQGKEDVLEFVKAADVINVALGDVLGGTDAIIEVTKLAQVFKSTTKEIESAGLEETLIRTGSVINELGKTSTANEGQIEKFLMRIASYASIAGMSLDQMAGIGSVLSQNSKAPEMSATAVTKIMQQMIKKTGSFAEMIGMGEKELSDLMAKDFNQAFLAVLQKLHDIGDVQSIVPIFKDLGADATRASQVILALSTNIDRVREAQETANKAIKEGTSMNKEYSVMNDTLQAQMEKAKKTVFDARVELGEKLYPYIVKYTMFGGKVVKWLSKVTDHAENAWMAIAAAGALAIAKVRKNWDSLKAQFTELGPVQEFNAMKAAQKELSESKERQKTLQKQYNLTHKVSEDRSKRILSTENEIFKKTQQRVAVMRDLDYTEAGALSRMNSINAAEAELQAAEKERLSVIKRINANNEEQATLKTKLQAQEGELAKLAKDRELTEKRLAGLYTGPTGSRTAITAEENRLKAQQAQIDERINALEAERNATATALAAKQKEGAVLDQQRSAAAERLLLAEKRKAEVLKEHKAILQQIVEKGGAQGALAQKLLANEEELAALEKERLALMKEQEGTLSRERTIEKGITVEKQKQEALQKKTTFLSIIQHHWMLILTILIEVGMQIAKIVKKHREMANEAKKVRENIEKEKYEALLLFNALKNANLEEREKYKIMGEINSRYGDYLKNLRNEKGELISLEAAYKAVTRAIIDQNNAKGYKEAFDKMMDQMAPKLESSTKEIRNVINKMITGNEGISNTLADEIFGKVMEELAGSDNAEAAINKIMKRYGNEAFRKTYGKKIEYRESRGYAGFTTESVDQSYQDKLESLFNTYIGITQNINSRNKELMTLYSQNTKTLGERINQIKRDYQEAEDEATRLDKIAEARSAYAEYFLPEGWENYAKSDLEALVKQYNAQIKKAKKEKTTFWKVFEEEGLKAITAINNKMKEGGGFGTAEPETDGYDPDHPVTSGKKSGKSPEERWADLMRKSAKLNEKAVVESLGISSAKESVIKAYDAILKEVEQFNSKYNGFEERAAAEIARLEQEKWNEIARIEEEEHRKRLQKIEDNLASVTEKLNKFRLKQQRKHQTQLETDLEEIENDFSTLRAKAEKEREALQDRKDASNLLSSMFELSGDSDMVDQLMKHYKQLLSKFGVTAASWANAMKQNPQNAQDLLTLLGLDFDDEDQRTLDDSISKIKELDTAKIAESQSLASERAREIVTELSDTATRQYREAMKTIEDQIKTLEAAMQYLREHNDGGENDDRIREIEKTLAFLKGQKYNLQTKYDTGFGKDSLAALFGIDEQNWDNWGKNWEDNLEKMTDRLKTFADNVFDLWSSIDSIMQNQAEAEMQRTEELYDSKSAALKKQLDSGIISQKRYDAQMEKLQKEKEKKEKKLKHDAFERERAANLIQGAVNLALTISSIYAKEPGGLVIKSAAAAIAAAVQAVQIAAIASQPNPYAHGGYIEKKQYAVMGEEGPEWVASNKLLRDKDTKPIVAALDEYQKGDTRALERITMPAPALKNVSQYMPANGHNFAASNTTNYYYQAKGIDELLEETREMNKFLRDPNNRRAYITRKMQLEFEQQEEEVRAAARM